MPEHLDVEAACLGGHALANPAQAVNSERLLVDALEPGEVNGPIAPLSIAHRLSTLQDSACDQNDKSHGQVRDFFCAEIGYVDNRNAPRGRRRYIDGVIADAHAHNHLAMVQVADHAAVDARHSGKNCIGGFRFRNDDLLVMSLQNFHLKPFSAKIASARARLW